DIGAGGGYFSLRFAEVVGKEGIVYAIDTNPGFLEFIRDSAKEKGLDNIRTILTKESVPVLTEKVDLIFTRNVYHHLSNRVEYFKTLKGVLKPSGRISIIEYRRGGLFRRTFGHYVPQETIVEEMGEAGYQVTEKYDFLPEQSFTIFSLEE
ncbi:MAG: class I SAM-dependent methyltransferase, partial [Promethearchaeota archaeon]